MKKIFIIMLISLFTCGCMKKEVVAKTFYLEESFSIIPTVTIMDLKEKLNDDSIEKKLSNITKKLDEKFNVFKDDSMITQVNNNAGRHEVIVDEEFIYVLSEALSVANNTSEGGYALYDVSIFSVWREWKFNENYYQFLNYSSPPEETIIKQKLPLVNYNNIIINEEKNTVFLKEEGMAIDLGSVVKGYAAEKLKKYLEESGYYNCLIDVGGNVITMGKNIGTNKKWKAGILLPFSYDEEVGYINTKETNETLVTSGIYQRYILSKNEETGEEIMYHHILNPKTGYPENNDLLSVTIVTDNSLIADAYSTAIFLMGGQRGIDYVNKHKNIGAVFITKENEIIISDNLKSRFIVNQELINKGYKLKN